MKFFGPNWHDSITQILHICQVLIHDVKLMDEKHSDQSIWHRIQSYLKARVDIYGFQGFYCLFVF